MLVNLLGILQKGGYSNVNILPSLTLLRWWLYLLQLIEKYKPFSQNYCSKSFSTVCYFKYLSASTQGETPTKLPLLLKERNQTNAICVTKNFLPTPTSENYLLETDFIIVLADVHQEEMVPTVCELCWKRFIENVCLRIHQRVHIGEKLYNCKPCERCSTSQDPLCAH